MVYTYCEDDFVYETSWEHYIKLSPFDLALQSKWQSAVDNGYFRYRLNILDTRRLPGKYSFLAQLNPDRASNRRPPEDINSLTQPFDHEKFNFTKISENEILFEVKKTDVAESELKSNKDLLIINISPLEFGHSLVLPEVTSCLPQVITLYSLQKTFELVLLSNSPALRAGFNSLCGFATVNHLHFHLYYLNHDMLLENIKVEHLSGDCHVLTQFPAKGFAFQLNEEHNLFILASSVHRLTNFLQERNIAHNVCVTRGYSFNSDKGNNIKLDSLRVYVWARKHSTGPKNVQCFDPAICELFGHLVVKVSEPFSSLSESEVASELNRVCQEPFDAVYDDVRVLFQDNDTQ